MKFLSKEVWCRDFVGTLSQLPGTLAQGIWIFVSLSLYIYIYIYFFPSGTLCCSLSESILLPKAKSSRLFQEGSLDREVGLA